VAVIEKGRVAACGLLADIRKSPPTPFASKFLSTPSSEGVVPISDPVTDGQFRHN
jgi:hypothetical protein